MAGYAYIESERQAQRAIKLVQHEINSLTGQLHIATQTSMRSDLPGSRRARADKALRAIPQQLEEMKKLKESLIQCSAEIRAEKELEQADQ